MSFLNNNLAKECIKLKKLHSSTLDINLERIKIHIIVDYKQNYFTSYEIKSKEIKKN